MIRNQIHKVLSTFQSCGVHALLMGGQACVFYGAAEFSRDTDFAIATDPENMGRIEAALAEEERMERVADRIYWNPLRKELEQMRHASRPD